jgi:amidophosphoribosyltransferase
MCGIIGISAVSPVAAALVDGLTALQHRGQDAAGIVTLSDRFHMKKGVGLVNTVFSGPGDIASLRGNLGLGHVRYATQGTTDVFDAQPIAVHYPIGLAMVHNGNVTNFAELKERLNQEQRHLAQTSNDVELILFALATELERAKSLPFTAETLFKGVRVLHSKVAGAYSVIALIAGQGMLAFRDPKGIRPLLMGQKGTSETGVSIAFASETSAFDLLGYAFVRDVNPGESIFVDLAGNVFSSGEGALRGAFCAFEYVYFAREDSVLNGSVVASERVRAGRRLAKSVRAAGLFPDIVIDVPSSAYFAAFGLSEELQIPYRRGFSASHPVGRSFIVATQEERERMVRQKLSPIRDVVAGKKVAVVDDSIIRGTTSKHVVRALREAGAAAVYVISASPPVKHRCVYGIDMATKQEIIAANHDVEAIRAFIGADALVYQELADLRELYKDVAGCFACFSGDYPTAIGESTLTLIEGERLTRRSLPR